MVNHLYIFMEHTSLEHIVRTYIRLSHRPNSHGWWAVLCKVCNDHGRKGKRAGFLFDGPSVSYNCFNCGHSATYNPAEQQSFSKDMQQVLDSFGIPKDVRDAVLLTALVDTSPEQQARAAHKAAAKEPNIIPIPNYFQLIDPSNPKDDVDAYACEYLADRNIDISSQPFYVGRETNVPESKKWVARVVIPIMYKGQPVFYLGRDLTGMRQKRYLNLDIPRDHIIYGYDQLFTHSNLPLYITEGWFDAAPIGGVAIFRNKLSASQIAWINQSYRQKVVIPDKFNDGLLLAKQAISLGWSVSTPDIGGAKDVNEAIQRFGLMYTLKAINDNIYTGDTAIVRAELYCKL